MMAKADLVSNPNINRTHWDFPCILSVILDPPDDAFYIFLFVVCVCVCVCVCLCFFVLTFDGFLGTYYWYNWGAI